MLSRTPSWLTSTYRVCLSLTRSNPGMALTQDMSAGWRAASASHGRHLPMLQQQQLWISPLQRPASVHLPRPVLHSVPAPNVRARCYAVLAPAAPEHHGIGDLPSTADAAMFGHTPGHAGPLLHFSYKTASPPLPRQQQHLLTAEPEPIQHQQPTAAAHHSKADTASLDQPQSLSVPPGEQGGLRTPAQGVGAPVGLHGTTRVVVVGIDPDSRGAVAVASWDAQDLAADIHVQSLKLEVYDMPCAEVLLQKKSKATGKQVKRRWLDLEAARQLVITILEQHACSPTPLGMHTVNSTSMASHDLGDVSSTSNGHSSNANHSNGTSSTANNSNGTSNGSSSPPGNGNRGIHGSDRGQLGRLFSAIAPGAQRPVELRAYLESTPTMPFNSSPRTLAPQLHSVGGWHGLLVMAGFKACTVPATVWKKDMGLFGLDKTGSVALAKQLWPSHAGLLERVKDHGRAEAMLIAAWAMGARRPPPVDAQGKPLSPRPARRRAEAQPPSTAAAAVNGKQSLRTLMQSRAGISAATAASKAVAGETAQGAAVSAEKTQVVVTTAKDETGAVGLVSMQSPAELKPTSGIADWQAASGTDSDTEEVSESESDTGQTSGEEEKAEVVTDPAEKARLKQIEREQMELLVLERSKWPVLSGSLRDARATDGYGNPLPISNAVVMPALPQTKRVAATKRPAQPRQRKRSTTSEHQTDAEVLTPATEKGKTRARRGKGSASPAAESPAPPAATTTPTTASAKAASPAAVGQSAAQSGMPVAQQKAPPSGKKAAVPGAARTGTTAGRRGFSASASQGREDTNSTDSEPEGSSDLDALQAQAPVRGDISGDDTSTGIPGVRWNKQFYRWQGRLSPEGRRTSKDFRVSVHGSKEAAYAAAVQYAADAAAGRVSSPPARTPSARTPPAGHRGFSVDAHPGPEDTNSVNSKSAGSSDLDASQAQAPTQQDYSGPIQRTDNTELPTGIGRDQSGNLFMRLRVGTARFRSGSALKGDFKDVPQALVYSSHIIQLVEALKANQPVPIPPSGVHVRPDVLRLVKKALQLESTEAM